ncbi:MAG: NifB/NifX family molybdenum-iron cluster-binding protein [Bacteroidales bacterium]|nr:NifB/NifX family molybdenum-iron cluster-binding protein [Bacteroidales bacterium]
MTENETKQSCHIESAFGGLSAAADAPEHEHGAMPRFLAAEGCTDVICGGIGGGAVQLLNQLGISLHGGAPTMPVDEIVSRYLAGTLIYGDATCHHDNCGGVS